MAVQETDPETSSKKKKCLVVWVGGFLGWFLPWVILAIPCLLLYFERLAHVRGGGVGEKAATGEPLFYLGAWSVCCLVGIPIGIVAALLVWRLIGLVSDNSA